MSALARRHALVRAQAKPVASSFAALAASLAPITWLRCNDNAADNIVIDSSASMQNGTLLTAINNTTSVARNSADVSNVGLVAGDTDRAFLIAGESQIQSPHKTLADATGWTAFAIIQPDVAPASSNGYGGAIFQLTNGGNSCPEIDIIGSSGSSSYRLRLMRSGSSEIAMTATPTYSYGQKLALLVRKRAGGVADIYVNGVLVASSTSAVSWSYGSRYNMWGSAYFTGAYMYALTGTLDEPMLFDRPLTDAECEALTSAPL